MAKQPANTTETVEEPKQVTQAELDEHLANAARVLGEHKTRSVTIPKAFKGRIQNPYPVGINGAFVFIPIGEKVDIPEPFADLLENVLNNMEK